MSRSVVTRRYTRYSRSTLDVDSLCNAWLGRMSSTPPLGAYRRSMHLLDAHVPRTVRELSSGQLDQLQRFPRELVGKRYFPPWHVCLFNTCHSMCPQSRESQETTSAGMPIAQSRR